MFTGRGMVELVEDRIDGAHEHLFGRTDYHDAPRARDWGFHQGTMPIVWYFGRGFLQVQS